jgi:hypothetical protein
MMSKLFAIIEDNKVVNIVVDVDAKDLKKNPSKYIDYTDGWDYSNGIDGGDFFPHEAAPE